MSGDSGEHRSIAGAVSIIAALVIACWALGFLAIFVLAPI